MDLGPSTAAQWYRDCNGERMNGLPTLPLWGNLAVFLVAATAVWMAGTRLAAVVDEVGERTTLGHAFLGMVLLGVATSLPEIATTVSGALIGNPQLVTGNLFGGVSMQIAVLAIVDAAAVKGALTSVVPRPILLFQGVMLLLLLAVALTGAAIGDPLSIFGVGLTPILLGIGYLLTVRGTAGGRFRPRWRPTGGGDSGTAGDDDRKGDAPRRYAHVSSTSLAGRGTVMALVILGAGWALAIVGDALSVQTGLGASFVGVALVAVSTSLPELSTTLGAARQGNFQMAVSNILGTNCLEVALFLLADVFYDGGPILAAVDASALFAAGMALTVTCLLLLGLLERRDRVVLGMGVDSASILTVYLLGLGGLYYLR